MVRIIENYTLYQVIGEGAYGKVYRAVNKLDNKEYAVKVIEVKKFQANKKLQQCTVHQINILSNIQKNNHIICYYDMLKTPNNFYFVYEYCNGGTLEGMLRKKNYLDEKSALIIFKQLLEAFQVLNKYNIMHRDLKPDNIFFHNGVVKVGDFGFCKNLQKAEMTKTMLGSPIYMAPEILNGQIYSNKADIWSIGVVLYEMLYGYCPFQSNSIPKLIQVLRETQINFPEDIPVSMETKNLIRKILSKDCSKRIEWMELFKIDISSQGKISSNEGFKAEKRLYENTEKEETSSLSPTSPNSPPFNSSTTSNFSPSHFGNFISPRNATSLNNTDSQKNKNTPTQAQPAMKYMHTKKPQGTISEAETVPNPPAIRKIKSADNGQVQTKSKFSKFHAELVRGINIARSMGLNNEKLTPLFSYFIFKNICDRIALFKKDELANVSQLEVKQFKELLDSESDELNYEMAMMRNKIDDYQDWKKSIKIKLPEVKNIRLCYELIMFLSGESSSQSITLMEMKNVIKTKLS